MMIRKILFQVPLDRATSDTMLIQKQSPTLQGWSIFERFF